MPWTVVAARLTDDEFDDFRDGPMCCFNTYNTGNRAYCTLCEGVHVMKERRFECGSLGCYRAAIDLEMSTGQDTPLVIPKRGGKKSPCPTIWKVRQCTVHNIYQAATNSVVHMRGDIDCTFVGAPKLTQEAKAFMASEDECGMAPRNILIKMKKDVRFPKPRRGWPTPKQIANALKYIRIKHGTKNSLLSVEKLVHEWCYTPDIDPELPFLFGPFLGDDGFPHVGTGEDDDPFILGITSVALLSNCAKFVCGDRPTIFHADATFKLSDLGYPVITCGFTDEARSYQLAAMFVVSRRTAIDYMRCFNSLMARFRDIRVRSPRVEFVMGDAEDAQFNGIQGVPEFAGAKVLMCFFHVLYNVRKKIRHMSVALRKAVMIGIINMHFSIDLQEYTSTRDSVLSTWRSTEGLISFSKYFEQQWLGGRYWRWQAFHTPAGYAVTNNPCEIFNASLKSYFQRRRFHMELLIRKLGEKIDVTPINPPAPPNTIPTPSTDVSSAGKLMLQAGKLNVVHTESPEIIRVLHTKSTASSSGPKESDDDVEFFDAFDNDDAAEEVEPETTDVDAEDPDERLFAARTWDADVATEKERESARKLYDNAVKWSIKYSHQLGQPAEGWTVDLLRCSCNCRFFAKFGTCAHIVAGRLAKRMPKPGIALPRMLKSRIVGKRKSTASKGSAKKAREHRRLPVADVHNPSSVTPSSSPPGNRNRGRPPLATRALDVQFLLN